MKSDLNLLDGWGNTNGNNLHDTNIQKIDRMLVTYLPFPFPGFLTAGRTYSMQLSNHAAWLEALMISFGAEKPQGQDFIVRITSGGIDTDFTVTPTEAATGYKKVLATSGIGIGGSILIPQNQVFTVSIYQAGAEGTEGLDCNVIAQLIHTMTGITQI